jgi:hypothetical protein
MGWFDSDSFAIIFGCGHVGSMDVWDTIAFDALDHGRMLFDFVDVGMDQTMDNHLPHDSVTRILCDTKFPSSNNNATKTCGY